MMFMPTKSMLMVALNFTRINKKRLSAVVMAFLKVYHKTVRIYTINVKHIEKVNPNNSYRPYYIIATLRPHNRNLIN